MRIINNSSYMMLIAVLLSCNNHTSGGEHIESQIDSITVKKKSTKNYHPKIDPTGTYFLDSKTEEKDDEIYGYFGRIQVKKIGQNQIAVTFLINKGAPSYNMGAFIDTLEYINHIATYKGDKYTPDCRIVFEFTEKGINVDEKTIDFCGFGANVSASGFFKKTSSIEPILEDPETGKRLNPSNALYPKQIKNGKYQVETIPKSFQQLIGTKITGLTLEESAEKKEYYVGFSAACRCEGTSILIKFEQKKFYLFPYCSKQPTIGEYANYEYKIESTHLINNKLVLCGVANTTDYNDFKLVFGKLDNKNVFSLETEGQLPEGIYLDKYITNNEKLFRIEECGDYDG